MKKTFLAALLLLTVLLSAFSLCFPARAATNHGQCGPEVNWSFNSDTGELLIYGKGEMMNYYAGSGTPWRPHYSEIRTVTIEEGVTRVGRAAFWDLTNLEVVSIPSTVTIIETEAFSNCPSLREVIFAGDQLTQIGDRAFAWCSSLESIYLPDNITKIGAGAFSNCSSLTNVTIPSGVTTIPSSAFNGCSSLKEVTFPSGMNYIADNAFKGCTSLTSLSVPMDVRSIGDCAFMDCSALTNVYFESFTQLGAGVFDGCPLESVVACADAAQWIKHDPTHSVSHDLLSFHDFAWKQISENDHTGRCGLCGAMSQGAHKYVQNLEKEEYKITDPTCVEYGTYYSTCVCGKRSSKVFNGTQLVPHDYKATASTNLTHEAVCTVCGDETGKQRHTYGDWNILIEATPDQNGIRERVCSVCLRAQKDIYFLEAETEPSETYYDTTESPETYYDTTATPETVPPDTLPPDVETLPIDSDVNVNYGEWESVKVEISYNENIGGNGEGMSSETARVLAIARIVTFSVIALIVAYALIVIALTYRRMRKMGNESLFDRFH